MLAGNPNPRRANLRIANMPWTKKQNKLFRAAEHNPKIAKKVGISQAKAKKMAHEGIKKGK